MYNIYVPDENISIGLEQLLQRVSEQEIMSWIFGDEYDEFVKSPVRHDSSAGCYFDWHNGRYVLVDWGHPHQKNWTAFDIIMHKHGCGFHEAVKMVDSEMSKTSFNAIKPKDAIRNNKSDFLFHIYPVYRQFNSTMDKVFWSKRGISASHLIQDHVVAAEGCWVNSRKSPHLFKPVIFHSPAYVIHTNEHRKKIYRPYESKKEKWIYSNVQKDDILFLDLLPAKDVILTKSYKDARILINMGYTALSVQGEKSFPSDWMLYYIISRCDRLIILFDTDATGKMAGYNLCEYINHNISNKAEQLVYPDRYNDTDDYYINNKEELKLFMNHEVGNPI